MGTTTFSGPVKAGTIREGASANAGFGTTNTLDIGDGTTADKYADALALGSAARVLATSDVSQIGNLIDIGTSDVAVTTTYNQSGSAASAGAATVTVLYIQNNNLS